MGSHSFSRFDSRCGRQRRIPKAVRRIRRAAFGVIPSNVERIIARNLPSNSIRKTTAFFEAYTYFYGYRFPLLWICHIDTFYRTPLHCGEPMPHERPGRFVDIAPTETASIVSDRRFNDDFAEPYIWHWHVKSNAFRWCNQRVNAPNRKSDGCAEGIDAFLEIVSAEDRDAVARDVTASISGTSTAREVTLEPASGNTLRVQLTILPICDRSGQVVSIMGLCSADHSAVEKRSSDRAALLSQAEEIAKFGSWEFDVESREAELSPHLARMLGIASNERLSEVHYWKRVHSADRAAVLESVTAAIAAGSPFEYVARYLPVTGGTCYHFVRGLPNFDRSGRLKSFIGITFDFTDQTHIETELHRLSQKLLRARDDERRGIARELHESTGQTLAAVKMSLGRLREALSEEDPRIQGLVKSAAELAETAIREIRTLSYLMHPPMLDEAGLRSAVHWYAKGFTERSGIPIQVSIPEDLPRYGQEVETTLFRIVQEALTNIHRYSGSRSASIRLTAEDDVVHAVIQDDGCGLPSPGFAYGRDLPLGVGIVGMRERVKQLNGTFEIYSAPGKGTTIRATLPLRSGSRRRPARIVRG